MKAKTKRVLIILLGIVVANVVGYMVIFGVLYFPFKDICDFFGINKYVGKNEHEAMEEYRNIVPGETFNKDELKYCEIIGQGQITENCFNKLIGWGWSIRRLNKEFGTAYEDNHVLTISDNAEWMYSVFTEYEGYRDVFNLEDDTVEAADLEGAVIYVLKLTTKEDIITGPMGTPGEQECHTLVVVSKCGYVLFKQDAENTRYIQMTGQRLRRMAESGDYVMGIDTFYNSYPDCLAGRDIEEDELKPRTPNEMRADLGLEPLEPGWHKEFR